MYELIIQECDIQGEKDVVSTIMLLIIYLIFTYEGDFLLLLKQKVF